MGFIIGGGMWTFELDLLAFEQSNAGFGVVVAGKEGGFQTKTG
jgi:hypothetical protein